jgi:hypothetical protein
MLRGNGVRFDVRACTFFQGESLERGIVVTRMYARAAFDVHPTLQKESANNPTDEPYLGLL